MRDSSRSAAGKVPLRQHNKGILLDATITLAGNMSNCGAAVPWKVGKLLGACAAHWPRSLSLLTLADRSLELRQSL